MLLLSSHDSSLWKQVVLTHLCLRDPFGISTLIVVQGLIGGLTVVLSSVGLIGCGIEQGEYNVTFKL